MNATCAHFWENCHDMTRDNTLALIYGSIIFGPPLVLTPWLLTGSAALTGLVLVAALATAIWALVQ